MRAGVGVIEREGGRCCRECLPDRTEKLHRVRAEKSTGERDERPLDVVDLIRERDRVRWHWQRSQRAVKPRERGQIRVARVRLAQAIERLAGAPGVPSDQACDDLVDEDDVAAVEEEIELSPRGVCDQGVVIG
jgi:hypothetical protein